MDRALALAHVDGHVLYWLTLDVDKPDGSAIVIGQLGKGVLNSFDGFSPCYAPTRRLARIRQVVQQGKRGIFVLRPDTS